MDNKSCISSILILTISKLVWHTLEDHSVFVGEKKEGLVVSKATELGSGKVGI